MPTHKNSPFSPVTQPANGDSLNTITMRELIETAEHSIPDIIDNLLRPGVYLFAGAPKLGKSSLALQTAYCVSSGQPLLNNEVNKGAALFVELEDARQQMRDAVLQMFDDETDSLHFAFRVKSLAGGLTGQLESFAREHPDTGLIVINSLHKIADTGGRSRPDFGALKELAREYGLCIVLVHHIRAQK